MLASHALVLVGVPLNRVLRRIREARSQRYRLLRGFFHGMTDRDEEEESQPRLHSVWLTKGASAIGQTLAEVGLERLGCEVSAIRRRGIRAVEPAPETLLQEGDVVVVLGDPEAVSAAEQRLIKS
jgi:CPA2 family monovalent cation:H+ antiporter-2